MKSTKYLLILLCFLVSFLNVQAKKKASRNTNQYLYGQKMSSPYENSSNSKKDKSKSLTIDDIKYNQKKSVNGYFPKKDNTWRERTYREPERLRFLGKEKEIVTYKNEELAKEYAGRGNSGLSFTYIYDTYDYADRAGIFKRTFENSDAAKSIKSGYLTFSYKNKFSKGERFSLLGDLSLAVSYATGDGLFGDTGEKSLTRFQFWTIPLEFMIGGRVSLGNYVDLNLVGGPAVAFIIQNRNDREDGAKDKKIQQVGYGFSGYASLDFSLTRINPNYAVSLKRTSSITDMSISIMLKTTSLANFKNEDFEISGTSFGLSFNFEYL